jgi:hypothetical protein
MAPGFLENKHLIEKVFKPKTKLKIFQSNKNKKSQVKDRSYNRNKKQKLSPRLPLS